MRVDTRGKRTCKACGTTHRRASDLIYSRKPEVRARKREQGSRRYAERYAADADFREREKARQRAAQAENAQRLRLSMITLLHEPSEIEISADQPVATVDRGAA